MINLHIDNGIATLTLNDGKANAISHEMIAACNQALDEAAAAKAILIITSSSQVLSAGFHLPTMMASSDARADLVTAGFSLLNRIVTYPLPVIVANPGHAMAMGAFILLAADYRIGAQGQYKIGFNEVEIGLPMPLTGVAFSRHRLSHNAFFKCVNLAEIQSPAEARDAGFLDAVVESGELLEKAQQQAEGYKKLNPTAFAITRQRTLAPLMSELDACMQQDDKLIRQTPIS